MKKRYSITYCNREGMRAILPSCNYSTSKEAENWLRLLTDRIKSLRQPPEIKRKLQATLRVDPVECHDTGEPLCLYIDDPYSPMQQEWHSMGVCDYAGCGFCNDQHKN